MTLIEFLQSLPELATPGTIVEEKGLKPQALYVWLDEDDRIPQLEASNMSTVDAYTTQVNIVRPATLGDRTPDASDAVTLYQKIRRAVFAVNAAPEAWMVKGGFRVTSHRKPSLETESGDVWGFVRFETRFVEPPPSWS